MEFLAQSFLNPMLLSFMAAIPVLWWLMRLLPPPVRKIRFPAAFLLVDEVPRETTASRMPWWIFILRALAVFLFVLSFAHPVFDRETVIAGNGGAVAIVIDNGWASAAHWDERISVANRLLTKIAQSDRSVLILPTAPDAETAKLPTPAIMSADEARSYLSVLKPMPWSVDQKEAADILSSIAAAQPVSQAVYIGDGVAYPSSNAFLDSLAAGPGLTIVNLPDTNTPILLEKQESNRKSLEFTMHRLSSERDHAVNIRALAENGGLVDQKTVLFSGGDTSVSFDWQMPDEQMMRVARYEAGSQPMASATYYLQNKAAAWAGILTDGTVNPDNSILSDSYYLKRALQEDYGLQFGNLSTLMEKHMPVILWPDSVLLTDEDRQLLQEWVLNGGRLIRFSGVNLVAGAEKDTLLPVPLRREERVMKNGLTGQEPLHIKDISIDSPLSGLEIPSDVTITRQALALPTPEVFEKTWVSLDDGTPLVTAATKEKGDIILIHTTAGPSGSTLAYSGFYVEMLGRLISGFSTDAQNVAASGNLVLKRKIDAFGRLQSLNAREKNISVSSNNNMFPSPETPPGFYEGAEGVYISNLGSHIAGMMQRDYVPSSATVMSMDVSSRGDNIRQFLLGAALALFLLDIAVKWIVIRGISMKPFAAMIFALVMMTVTPAGAQQKPSPSEMAAGVYVGHLKTGDQQLDNLAHRGLQGLQEVIRMRSTIDMRGVVAVDPEQDDLSFYPMLYWPLTSRQAPLTQKAMLSLQAYMRQGGLLMIDTRDGGDGDAARQTLQRMLSVIAIPALAEVTPDHILSRSFYLLKSWPGVTASQHVWVEKEPDPNNDSVTSIIVGGNDWAAAWSMDATDRQRFAITPDGEAQREMAYRFGMNVMMMALAGNYKSDQIHVNEMLKRFGK